MLQEPIKYNNNLPFSANFINVREEPSHYHKEIEILLLLRGFSNCKIYHMDYALQPGDMIIADVEDLHRIHDSSEDVLFLQLHIDTMRFEEIYPNIGSTYFVCEDPGNLPDEDFTLKNKQILMKHQLAKLIMDCMYSPSDFVLQTNNVNDIIATLIHHFRGFYMQDYQYRVGRDNVSEVDLKRMPRITNYLLLNYDKKISLEDLSATEHLNPYYVSHLIKKTLGIHFQDFLNGIRLEFAEKTLLFTSQTLTQVSENCGFSSPNYFNKCFNKCYGLTPRQYRKNISQGDRLAGYDFTLTEALERIGHFLTPVTSIKKLTLAPSMVESPLAEGRSTSPDDFLPRILLKTPEDLMGLGFLRDRVLAISPGAFLVNRHLLTPSVHVSLQTFGIPVEPLDISKEPCEYPQAQNTAMALSHIISNISISRAGDIPIFGEKDCLFLREGLSTPYYIGYQILSWLRGNHMTVSPQALLSHSGKELRIVLYNSDPQAILNVHMETKNLPEQFVLMKKQIPEENNCYAVLEALGHPAFLPAEVVHEIDQSHLGVPYFLIVNRSLSPVLDFMIYPQHVTLLVFSCRPA